MNPVRRATESHAPAIAAVEQAAADAPWSEASIRTALGASTTLAWVAGEPVIAHLLTCCVAEEAEILTLAVHPDVQRQGWGAALLAACEAYWSELGVRSAWLEVRADNSPAQALYATRGWVEAGLRRSYYADGVDAQVMRWHS